MIEPGMQPFHHPAPGTLARLPQGLVRQLLRGGRVAVIAVPPIGTHMLDVAARLHLAQCALVVIAGIQAQMLRVCLIGLGTGDDDGIQGSRCYRHIGAIGCCQHHRQRQPMTLTQARERLVPRLRRSTGLAPVAPRDPGL